VELRLNAVIFRTFLSVSSSFLGFGFLKVSGVNAFQKASLENEVDKYFWPIQCAK